jgi:cellulose synthase/poly-beta-1,6-N-acetylglucosamine synthase-like glycosyltransferase
MLIFLYVSRSYHRLIITPVTITPIQNPALKALNKYNSNPVTCKENILLLHDEAHAVIDDSVEYSHIVHRPENIQSCHDDQIDILNPMVSVIIASNNEENVIGTLMHSLEMLTYDQDKFEVIIVDDSHDKTVSLLDEASIRMKNLRVVRRKERIGCKGAALNLALPHLRKNSAWTIVLDADSIVPPDMIEKFLNVLNSSDGSFRAVQGYCIPYNNLTQSDEDDTNWVSKGAELRIAQRNMIEFVARNKLQLPLQITGTFFMIKSSVLKEVGFSTDLCEDWDLTLSLYSKDNMSFTIETAVLFDENLNASNQAPTSLWSYFKQRLRVSEGHTRGFIRMIPKIISGTQPLKNKIEIIFTGFRYLKYALLVSLIIVDVLILTVFHSTSMGPLVLASFCLQLLCLIAVFLMNFLGTVTCIKNKQYTRSFIISKILLEICSIPALIIGSFLGIVRKKGTFYKTRRNQVGVKIP